MANCTVCGKPAAPGSNRCSDHPLKGSSGTRAYGGGTDPLAALDDIGGGGVGSDYGYGIGAGSMGTLGHGASSAGKSVVKRAKSAAKRGGARGAKKSAARKKSAAGRKGVARKKNAKKGRRGRRA